MFHRTRRPRERVLLPGETFGRRRFIQGGLAGALLLAAAGLLVLRRKEAVPVVGGPYAVLTPLEAAILLAVARRVVPPGPPFPSAESVRVTERVDAFLAMSHRGVQRDVKRLLALFDSALLGLIFDRSPARFRTASPEVQDARLKAWSECRLAFRRTGFRALRRLVCSAYYSSPATWGALGYPGPPVLSTPAPAPPGSGPPFERLRPPQAPTTPGPAEPRPRIPGGQGGAHG